MPQVPATLFPGTIIRGRYQVVDVLGKGGFSAVYLIQDRLRGDSLFALKEVHALDKETRDLFTVESTLLQRLVHPALPQVHDVFDDEEHGRMYMLMDYIEGPDLETLRHIQPAKRFPLAVTTAILAPIANAIEYLHQQYPPIIHRDIKPANIIAPVVGGKIILVDFGIAKEYDSEQTTSAVRHATPGYGAPEHYSTGTNIRSDIYGLGATLFTLLTGELPPDALERMMQLSNEQPDPLKPVSEYVPTIPLHIAKAIKRAMAINMAQRFASVEEFWQSLQEGVPAQNCISEALSSIGASPTVPEVAAQPGGRSTGPLQRREPRISDAFKAKNVSPTTPEISAQAGVTSSQPMQVQAKQLPTSRSGKRFLLAIFVALSLIVVAVAGLWVFFLSGGQHAIDIFPTPIPHSTVTATVSVPLSKIPHLAPSYVGTFSTSTSDATSSMTLSQMRQNKASISGYFRSTQLSGTYQGVFDSPYHLIFTVTGSSPLHFSGTVNKNGHIAGWFCSSDVSGVCSTNGLFGVWSVVPVTAPRSETLLAEHVL